MIAADNSPILSSAFYKSASKTQSCFQNSVGKPGTRCSRVCRKQPSLNASRQLRSLVVAPETSSLSFPNGTHRHERCCGLSGSHVPVFRMREA